jgi:hypothetical protein
MVFWQSHIGGPWQQICSHCVYAEGRCKRPPVSFPYSAIAHQSRAVVSKGGQRDRPNRDGRNLLRPELPSYTMWIGVRLPGKGMTLPLDIRAGTRPLGLGGASAKSISNRQSSDDATSLRRSATKGTSSRATSISASSPDNEDGSALAANHPNTRHAVSDEQCNPHINPAKVHHLCLRRRVHSS